MPTRLALFLAALLALPAQAQELAPVLADYRTNNGSLPPPVAWQTSVLIREDGRLELTHCKGYETEGPACRLHLAEVPDSALAAIRRAARDSGLIERPARETDAPTVGGAMTWGRVNLPEGTVLLPAQPTAADAERVARVLAAIANAIPPGLGREAGAD